MIALALVLGLGSCDYLDVVPDNVATIEYAFRNRVAAEKYLFTCYSYRPPIGSVNTDPAMNGSDESCQRYSTQNIWPNFPNSWIARGTQSSVEPWLNFWDGLAGSNSLWVGIRDCNIFLEGIDNVPDLNDYEKKRWIAEVKFLKAYYHYYLMKCYGPVPIVDTNLPISASTDQVRVYREPIDNVVEYISNLMYEASVDLPNANEVIEGTEAGRVDKLAALTMRAELLVFAASPLFNGNTDFASMIDNRGVVLFPQTYDPDKWKVAADACKGAIDVCVQQGKGLYDLVDPVAMVAPAPFQLQTTYRQAICDRWNKELIWGSTNYNCGFLAQYATPRLMRMPDVLNNCTSEWAPTIKLAETYYSSRGVPISEDTQWQSQNWYNDRYKIRGAVSSGDEVYYVKEGEATVYLHYNREPRFYASLGFDKGIYFGNGYYDFAKDVKYCNFVNLQVSGYQGGSGYSATGYAAKKGHSLKNAQTASMTSVEYFPFPILRLADLYLLYAEALNEQGGPSEEVFYYLDEVRKRAGLEGVVDSWSKYSTNPTKPTSQNGLREIIHQERSIELALEGKRFWDIRRWKQIDRMNELVLGWNIMGETKEDFYNLKPVSYYNLTEFTIKDYFWPIRESNISVNSNLVQNYGW